MRVLDPMNLVNLSKSDLMVLFDKKNFYTHAWKSEAMKYKKVVRVCVRNGLHAGDY